MPCSSHFAEEWYKWKRKQCSPQWTVHNYLWSDRPNYLFWVPMALHWQANSLLERQAGLKIYDCPGALPSRMTINPWQPLAVPTGPEGRTTVYCKHSLQKALWVLLLRKSKSQRTTALSPYDTGPGNPIAPLTEVGPSAQMMNRLTGLRPSTLRIQCAPGGGVKVMQADHCPGRDTASTPGAPVFWPPTAQWSFTHHISS